MQLEILDFTIYYDKDFDISEIKQIIENNYQLIKLYYKDIKGISFIPTNKDNILYVEDFNSFFLDIIEKEYFNLETKNNFKNPNLLMSLYIEYKVREINSEVIKPNFNIPTEILLNVIAYKYYEEMGTKEDFINYLKNRLKTDEIIKWLQDKTRFQIYNYFLKIAVENIKESYKDFYSVIIKITDKITEDFEKNFQDEIEEEVYEEIIDFSEVENLFLNFLDFIKAPSNWKEKYFLLKNDLGITFNKEEESRFYLDSNHIIKININSKNEIDAFYTLVHEFVHYLSYKENYANSFLNEFPSIYFEMLAITYLQKINYRRSLALETLNNRRFNNIEIYFEYGSIYKDIVKYSQIGIIRREDELENILKLFRDVNSFISTGDNESKDIVKLKEISERLNKLDILEVIDKKYDNLNEIFLKKGLEVLDGYKYLLGTMLAFEINKKVDDTILGKMFLVVDNLDKYTLNDILKEFDIEYILQDKDNNKK